MTLGPIIVPASGATVPNLPSDLTNLVACWNFGNNATFDAGVSATQCKNLVPSPADGAAQADYDLQRGDGSTSTTYPTPWGAGQRVDGGDYWSLIGSNTTLFDGLHKDNATWSAIFHLFLPTWSSGNNPLMGTADDASEHGVAMNVNVGGSGKFYFAVANGNINTVAQFFSDSQPTMNQWTTLGLSADINGTSFFYQDGSYLQVSSSNTFTATITASATDATRDFKLAANGGASAVAQSGMIMGVVMFYNAAITKAAMDAARTDLRDPARFAVGLPYT